MSVIGNAAMPFTNTRAARTRLVRLELSPCCLANKFGATRRCQNFYLMFIVILLHVARDIYFYRDLCRFISVNVPPR
jgi:hypothetical protein